MFDKQSAASEMLMEHIYEDLIFETSEKRTEELLQKLSRKEIGFPFQSAAVVNMQVREHTFFVNDKVKIRYVVCVPVAQTKSSGRLL